MSESETQKDLREAAVEQLELMMELARDGKLSMVSLIEIIALGVHTLDIVEGKVSDD